MVGSAKNRRRLAAALREAELSARDTTKTVVLDNAPGSQLGCEVVWENGRCGLYLRIRGDHKDKSTNIDGNFATIVGEVIRILREAGIQAD